MKNTTMTINSDPCSMGEGRKVEIVIDEMGITGVRVSIERRFSGGKQSSRYQAAVYIRSMRKAWRNGALLDMLMDGQK